MIRFLVWCGVGLVFAGSVLAQVPRASKKAPGKAAAAGRTAANQEALKQAEEEAQRGEWSRWRGPAGDGLSRETGLLDSWPEGGPPLAWRTKGLGGGYASVAIADGKIYTLGERGSRTSLICRKVEDGSEVWQTEVGGGEGPNCTPTVDGELVSGLTHGGDLFCCNAVSGELIWTKSFTRDFDGQVPTWGYSESPLVDGDRLICTPGSREALLVALDKRTGEVQWKTEVPAGKLSGRGHDGAGYSSIVIGQPAGVKQYITLVGKGVVGVDAATGKLLWEYDSVANGTASIPTPIVAGDHVFCSSGYGTGSALIKVNRAGNGFAVQEVYFLPANKMQNHHGGMIQKDGFVYCGHGHNEGFPLCIDGRNGKEAWRPGRGPGSGSAAVAYADGHLYFRYQDATMALIEANPKAYKLKGKFKLASRNGESWPHPVIAGGKLYIRDQDELLCYDIKQ